MKKFIVVILVVLLAAAALAGCGGTGGTGDLSSLQKQVEDLSKKVTSLETKNQEQQNEMDRLYGQYDWNNPIVITNLTAFKNLFDNNRAEFDKLYYAKVIQITAKCTYTSNYTNPYPKAILLEGLSAEFFFPGFTLEQLSEKVQQTVTVLGVYDTLSRSSIHINSCRFK